MSDSIKNTILSKLEDISQLNSILELDKMIEKELKDLEKLKNINIDAVKQEYTKQIISYRKSKKRWLGKELEPGSFFYQELNDATNVLTGSNGIMKFQERYKVDDLQMLRSEITESMHKWVEDDSSLLLEFRYFEGKLKWQKNRAIQSDVKILCLKEIIEQNQYVDKPQILHQLTRWGNVPVDHSGRRRFQEIQLDGDYKKIGIMTIDLSADTQIQQKLTIDSTRNELYNSALIEQLLDGDDMAIMRFMLTKLSENKYINREIKTSRKEILKALNLSSNGRNYDLISAAIIKLSSVKVYFTSPTVMFNLGFLSNFEFEEDGGITVYMDNAAYKQALSGKVISMYKNVIDSLSSSAAVVIYKLQMERIERIANNKPLIFTVDVSFFKNVLILDNKRKERVQGVIEKVLDEIASTGVTLKRYIKITDGYYEIELYPLTQKEMIDLGTTEDSLEPFAFTILEE